MKKMVEKVTKRTAIRLSKIKCAVPIYKCDWVKRWFLLAGSMKFKVEK
jgi:hypothetical protein